MENKAIKMGGAAKKRKGKGGFDLLFFTFVKELSAAVFFTCQRAGEAGIIKGKKPPSAAAGRGQAGEARSVDTIDRQILEILERDARTPLKKIAAAVFLSPPAVSARIERMEQRGVITGYRALVDPQRLGYAITALINIAILPKHQPAFAQFVKGCSNVTECYHVAGTYSMLLKACFATTGQVDSFVESLQRYGKTQTQIVLSTVVEPREVEPLL